ncbi:MAG TPA: hypothetical protein ENI23_10700 [bacterium]|nr:hypothetical protein [bacterium]
MRKLFVPIIIFFVLISSLFLISSFSTSRAEEFDAACERYKALNNEKTCPTNFDPDIKTNIFGIEFTSTQADLARYVRSGLTIALGLLVTGAVFYGFYGMYVRTTAGDNEEKLKQSVSIFKNAILGIVIAFGGIFLIQIISSLLGLGNIWEIALKSCEGPAPITKLRGIPFNCVNGEWVAPPLNEP